MAERYVAAWADSQLADELGVRHDSLRIEDLRVPHGAEEEPLLVKRYAAARSALPIRDELEAPHDSLRLLRAAAD